MTDSTGRLILSGDGKEIGRCAFSNNKNIEEAVVPASARTIGEGAFQHCSNLRILTLREGLEEIGPFAFWCCRQLETIVIPASVKVIHEKAFGYCNGLKRVTVLGKRTRLEDGVFARCDWNMELLLPKPLRVDQRLHLFDNCFLRVVRAELPQKDHSEDRIFRSLAAGCAGMNANAMWKMANYLESLGPEAAYTYAANFWRYRAQQLGHRTAKRWLIKWIAENPETQMPSLLPEKLEGYFSGGELRFCGFLFLAPKRTYYLLRPDREGVVEVSAWSSTEDADSDGFGMEECYDWWYLDEALQPIPGVEMVHDYSKIDKEASQKMFQGLHDEAARQIRSRRTHQGRSGTLLSKIRQN